MVVGVLTVVVIIVVYAVIVVKGSSTRIGNGSNDDTRESLSNSNRTSRSISSNESNGIKNGMRQFY